VFPTIEEIVANSKLPALPRAVIAPKAGVFVVVMVFGLYLE
jgi:hypothetical protein